MTWYLFRHFIASKGTRSVAKKQTKKQGQSEVFSRGNLIEMSGTLQISRFVFPYLNIMEKYNDNVFIGNSPLLYWTRKLNKDEESVPCGVLFFVQTFARHQIFVFLHFKLIYLQILFEPSSDQWIWGTDSCLTDCYFLRRT